MTFFGSVNSSSSRVTSVPLPSVCDEPRRGGRCVGVSGKNEKSFDPDAMNVSASLSPETERLLGDDGDGTKKVSGCGSMNSSRRYLRPERSGGAR